MLSVKVLHLKIKTRFLVEKLYADWTINKKITIIKHIVEKSYSLHSESNKKKSVNKLILTEK